MSLESVLVNNIINIICILGILSLGIAHGAIDNILYGAKPGKHNIIFIAKYITILVVFGCFWLLFPNVALLIFLLVSSYHFGQSQFAEYNFRPKMLDKFLFLTWGSLVLSIMFYCGRSEFLAVKDLNVQLLPIINFIVFYSLEILIVTALSFVVVFSSVLLLNPVAPGTVMKELYVLGLLLFSFCVLPAFVAFSLFFVWLHSLKVLFQEYEYCKEQQKANSLKHFIVLFLPLTFASLCSISTLLGILAYYKLFNLMGHALIILLACVTIPHSFVMDKFYTLLFPNE